MTSTYEKYEQADGRTKRDVEPTNFWKEIDAKQTELEGPYECPACGGHIMLDATHLDQVEVMVVCPYCEAKNYVQSVP